MFRAIATISSLLGAAVAAAAQTDSEPALIAKMNELGTVYLTRTPVGKIKKGEPKDKVKHKIVGVDFRPMAGTEPKKIASVVKEFDALPDVQSILLLGKDVTNEVADAIPASLKLTSIQLFNTSVTDKSIARLTRFEHLAVFKFTGSGLTDEGMKTLGKMKTLRTIEIVDAKVTDKGVMELRKLPDLQRLVVENTVATERGIQQLRLQLPNLRSGERFLR